jgi:dipeptidyl aminopeptidase/acylaminoacyl peptidase
VGRRVAGLPGVLITFNFSGSGIGEDPETFTELDRFEANTIGKELVDLGAVLDAVTARRVPIGDADIRKLGVLGHSRGGGVALIRTGRDPRIRSLVTWAAVSRFLREEPEERAAWREAGYREVLNARTGQVFRLGVGLLEDLEAHAGIYDPLAAVARIQVPTLLIHGTQDEAVSVEEGHALARAGSPGRCRLALIQGAGHTFGAAHPYAGTPASLELVFTKTLDWFRETLG